MPKAKSFFDEQTEQSLVKAEIVRKYFFAWANVIKQSVLNVGGRLAFIDLFCGPGRYKDGKMSVPVMLLEKAIQCEPPANKRKKNTIADSVIVKFKK